MKEAFYFSHDVNAIQDPKMMILLQECGLSGIGLYWIIIEILHQQKDGGMPLTAFNGYLSLFSKFDGKEYGGNTDVIRGFEIGNTMLKIGLLTDENGFIFSSRVVSNLNQRRAKSNAATDNINKRWHKNDEKYHGNTTVIPQKYERNTIKERKGNRERGTFTPPTVEEINLFCKDRNNSINAERFHDFYASKGWMVGKNKMKDWKACVRTWEQRDIKPNGVMEGF